MPWGGEEGCECVWGGRAKTPARPALQSNEHIDCSDGAAIFGGAGNCARNFLDNCALQTVW